MTVDLSKFYNDALTDNDEDQKFLYPLQTEIETISSRYTAFSSIGEGAAKAVYSSHDNKAGRDVAIAVLKSTDNKDDVESFFIEARLAAVLEHPNIMPVYDIGYLKDSRPFFSMKLIRGNSLEKNIWQHVNEPSYQKIDFDLKSRLNIFIKICDAISYAHSKGIIHLDIKPANIQLGIFGQVLVCDWGLSRLIDEPTDEIHATGIKIIQGMTLHGEVKGTPGFMAPEQILKEFGEKGTKSDIYSLGALLYNLLYLRIPFAGFDSAELLEQMPDTSKLNWSTTSNNPVHKSLQAVIKRAMAQNQSERYESVGELSEDIQVYLEGYPTKAEEAGFLRQLCCFYHRNRKISIFALLSAISVILLSILAIVNLRIREKSAIEALRLVDEREKALSLYQQEKEKTSDILMQRDAAIKTQEEALNELLSLAKVSQLGMADYNRAIRYCDIVLDVRPNDNQAHKLKAFCYIILQQPHLAEIEFAKMTRPSGFLHKIVPKYSDKINENGVLPLNITFQLMQEIAQENPNHRILEDIFNQLPDYSDMAIIMPMLKLVLKSVNKELEDDYKFDWNLAGDMQFLDLSNNPNLKNINPIQNLKLFSLNVSHTNVSYINAAANGVTELNIAQTRVTFLEFIKYAKKLRKITVTKRKIPKTQLGFLERKNLQVVNED